MQTHFSPAQLENPALAEIDGILRNCVHCGFCTATCPTFRLLGDELDSPRGRIYLIKEMLENDRPADALTVRHVDRCLSCLSCMTTCPSGVHYMHLVDHARAHIEKTWKRPFADRFLRGLIAWSMADRHRFAVVHGLAGLVRPLVDRLPLPGEWGRRIHALMRLHGDHAKHVGRAPAPAMIRPVRQPAGRVALLAGCVQPVLSPSINDAAIRLLGRFGVEVVLPKGEGCCGSLAHHMGREAEALAAIRHNIDVWTAEIDAGGLDAILITASGCGTTIKDYGHMLRDDPAYAAKAARVSMLARDISEYLGGLPLPAPADVGQAGLVVACHSACSLQHGQKIRTVPRDLLAAAGFAVREVPDGHLCCGSAGTYNILQSEIADRLKEEKLAAIAGLKPDVVAAGNIGCIVQLASGAGVPVLHTVELLDWAYGGERPARSR